MNQKIILYILVFFSLLLTNTCSQQNQSPHSLKQELIQCDNANDSVALLCRIAWFSNNTKDKQYYGQLALKTSEKIKDKALIADAHDAAALSFWTNNDLQKAKKHYIIAMKMGEETNKYDRVGWSSLNLARIAMEEKNHDNFLKYITLSRNSFIKTGNYNFLDYVAWVIIQNAIPDIDKQIIDTAVLDIKKSIHKTADPYQLYNYYMLIHQAYSNKLNNIKQSIHYLQLALDVADKVKDEDMLKGAYYYIAQYFRDKQKNYEIALIYFNRLNEINKNQNPNSPSIAEIHNEISNLHILLGNDSMALDYSKKSLEIAMKIDHKFNIAQAYRNMGEIYYNNNNVKAKDYYFKCLETSYAHDKIYFHDVLIKIGNIYLKSKDYPNSLKYLNKALKLADSSDAKYEKSVSFFNLAKYQETLGNYSLALKYYQKSLSIANEIGTLSLQYEGTKEISRLYSNLNNFKTAFIYLELSNKIADSIELINQADNLAMLETRFEFKNLEMQKELDKAKLDDEIARQKLVKNFLMIGLFFAGLIGFLIYLGYRRKKKDNSILNEQKRTIEQMSKKVHEADQKRLRFFTNVSHEFRTPLTLIFGPVEKLIKIHSNQDESSTLLKIIKRNTKSLYNLISQLLDIRKLDTGDVNLKVRDEDIVNYCKGIYSQYSHFAKDKSINFTFTTENKELTGWFDRDILEKVLNNLLSNAFKHIDRNGEIKLSVSVINKQGEEITHVQIQVSDNGKGIPEDQVQYVFDRYYQVENTNAGFNTGTGIGLAYTKELIELHKGEIHVESKLGQGTSFTITLPVESSYYTESEKLKQEITEKKPEAEKIKQEYVVQNIEMEAEVLPDVQQGFELEKEQVMLIVEDNADLRLFMRSIFEKEFMIYEAPDGKNGYRMANELIPDIIISDIMMPEMDGLELCYKLKNNIHTNHIPLLFLTAKAGDENELEGLKTGAIDYVSKPFDSDILFARINSLLAQKRALGEHFKREFILNPSEFKLISPDDIFLKKAVKIVEDNIMDPELNVGMLVKELAVSRRQLYRKIQAITNFPVNLFIRNIKLKRAAHLLQQNSLSMSEVLYQSGFSNLTHFKNCFKELFGCLPKDYASYNKISC